VPALFHITTRLAWLDALRTSEYRAPSLAEVGFIHLSTAEQWRATLARFFAGQSGLVLLEIDGPRIADAVRFEPVDGDEFPHLYGPLPVDAVIAVHEL
jgi:uncharacterized protein (DUF952 family)